MPKRIYKSNNTSIVKPTEPGVDDDTYERSNIDFSKRHVSESITVPIRFKGETTSLAQRRWRVEEAMLRACVAEGMSRDQIKDTMNLNDHSLGIIEKRLLANDGQLVNNQSTSHKFYIYTLQQEQCARDLEYVLQLIIGDMENWNSAMSKLARNEDFDPRDMPSKPSPQAAVMAIRAKSEIYDKTIKTGQEMGIIEKRARELRLSGNLNLSALSTEELKNTLDKKLKDFHGLVGNGKLPAVYQRLINSRNEPHAAAKRRGNDGSNLESEFKENTIRSMETKDRPDA